MKHPFSPHSKISKLKDQYKKLKIVNDGTEDLFACFECESIFPLCELDKKLVGTVCRLCILDENDPYYNTITKEFFYPFAHNQEKIDKIEKIRQGWKYQLIDQYSIYDDWSYKIYDNYKHYKQSTKLK